MEYPQIAEKLGIENQRDCLGYRITVKVLERIADHIENIAKGYIQLLEFQKDSALDDFVRLNESIVTIFEKSMSALFTRDLTLAEKILQKTMLDSLGRIASYSGEIAEIAINMSAGMLAEK